MKIDCWFGCHFFPLAVIAVILEMSLSIFRCGCFLTMNRLRLCLVNVLFYLWSSFVTVLFHVEIEIIGSILIAI